MTMKDRHVLGRVLEGCYRMQARADIMALRRSGKKVPIDSEMETAIEKDEPKKKANGAAEPELPKCVQCLTAGVKFASARHGNKGFCSDECQAAYDKKEPVPVAKGVKGPLGALVNGQKFFVEGVIGDFLLEGWKFAPGVFVSGSNEDLRKVPTVRQITQRRTSIKPEVLLKPQTMTAWFEETIVTVIEDFSLLSAPKPVVSSTAQPEHGEDEMAKAKKSAKVSTKTTNGNGAATGKRAEFNAKTIKVLAAENPKRKDSASYKRFALYKDGLTVGKFIEKGGTLGDVHYDVAHKFISVS